MWWVTRDEAVVISHNPSLNPDLVRDADSESERPWAWRRDLTIIRNETK